MKPKSMAYLCSHWSAGLTVWFAILAFCILSTGIGHARYLFWPNYGPMWEENVTA